MAVLSRLNFNSSQRLDIPDLLSVDSYASSDFKYLLNGLVGSSTPYVIKGFDVIDPAASIGGNSISVQVADSVVYCPSIASGSFFHGLEEGNAAAEPLVPELRKNATNYVYVTLSAENGGRDLRAFWDPDAASGEGDEFTQDVNTQTALTAVINVSTSSFPSAGIPICKVVYGATTITSIQDCRNMLFRLGSGGSNASATSTFSFRNVPDSTYARTEPALTMTSSSSANAFQGGDKNIRSLKEWMDAVMTRILELSGTTYWYSATNGLNFTNLFNDAVATTFKSKGTWSVAAGAASVTWSEDIKVKNITDPREIVIAGPTTKALANEEVLYLQMIRDTAIPSGISLLWTNGSATVTGATGAFTGLSTGDWIRKASEGNYKYVRILAISGSTSATIDTTYSGTTETVPTVYSKGNYGSSDISVATRLTSTLSGLGGNLLWLAHRSDTILKASAFTVTTSNNATFTAQSGTRSSGGSRKVKVVTTGAHSLSDGDYIGVTSGAYSGNIYRVEVEDSTTFYIPSVSTTSTTGNLCWVVITTAARSSSGYQLESATVGNIDQATVTIAGTTNFNGQQNIHQRSSSTFSMGKIVAVSTENPSAATMAIHNVLVRTELGSSDLLPAQTISIGVPDSEALRSFVGQVSAVDTAPDYTYTLEPTNSIPSVKGMEDYNAIAGESLVRRAARLTAMAADTRQDINITWDPGTITWDGTNITITGATLSIPGSDVGAAPITINTLSSTALPSNSCVVVLPDRNTTSTLTCSVQTIANTVPYPNEIVLVRNLGGTLLLRS